MFCQKPTFLAALRTVKAAYSPPSIAGRGVDEMRDAIVRDIGPFFEKMEEWAYAQADTINYGSAFDALVADQSLAHHAGQIAKHVALIQLAKPGSPAQFEVGNSIRSNLVRSGHASVWESLTKLEKDKYMDEVATATILYHLLALHGALKAGAGYKVNPIASLRRSMGERLPAEYFASLMAGWIAEDRFERAIKEAGATIELVAGDRDRRIKLKTVRKGRTVSINAEADFIVCGRPIDLQRVNSISETGGSGYAKLGIKHHKLTAGMAVIVWFSDKLGPKFGALKNGYCMITGQDAMRTIAGSSSDDAVVYVTLDYLRKHTTSSLPELIRRLKDLPAPDHRRFREDELPFGDPEV